MAIPFWDDDVGYKGQLFQTNPYDTLFLDKIQLPGLVTVKVTRNARVVNQKAPGRNGSTKIIKGFDDAELEATVTVWTPQQLQHLSKVLRQLAPHEGKTFNELTPQQRERVRALGIKVDGASQFIVEGQTIREKAAHDITHPQADLLGISHVVCLGFTGLVDGSKGEKTMTISMKSHTPTKPGKSATRRINGAGGDAPLAAAVQNAYLSTFSTQSMMSEARKPNG